MNRATDQIDAQSASDIRRDGWVERLLPPPARPYARLMRLDRPIGTWLLLFPCWWGMFLAISAAVPDYDRAILRDANVLWHLIKLMALFAIGSVVMRGAGCTYNDIVDRNFDAKVARTAARPIPSGQVSVRQALAFLACQLLVGLLVLVWLGRPAIGLGILSLGLVFTYPLMKRITYWPQAFLGLTFNWGIIMGLAIYPSGAGLLPTLLLYIGAVAWTLHYDTIYAHQDKDDDALVGVKSTALKFGNRTKPWLVAFSFVAVLMFAAAGVQADLGWPTMSAVVGVAVHLAWQIAAVDLDDPSDCLAKFRSNRGIGWILLAGIVASPWVQ